MCWTCLSSTRVFSLALVLLAMVGLLPPRAHGQTDRPWEHPAGPACFESWFQTSVSRLNAHNGSAGFNFRELGVLLGFCASPTTNSAAEAPLDCARIAQGI